MTCARARTEGEKSQLRRQILRGKAVILEGISAPVCSDGKGRDDRIEHKVVKLPPMFLNLVRNGGRLRSTSETADWRVCM